jgi:hypothetical protein
MLLFENSSKASKSFSTGATNHRGVLIAKFDELFTESLLLLSGAFVAGFKQRTRADTPCEPFRCCKLYNNGAEDVLDIGVLKCFNDTIERLSCSFSDDCLITSRKIFKKSQENSLVGVLIKDLTNFLGDGIKDFIIFSRD